MKDANITASQQITQMTNIWKNITRFKWDEDRLIHNGKASTRHRTRAYHKSYCDHGTKYTALFTGLKLSRLHGATMRPRTYYLHTISVMMFHLGCKVPHLQQLRESTSKITHQYRYPTLYSKLLLDRNL